MGGDFDILPRYGVYELYAACYQRYAPVWVAAFVAIFQVAFYRAAYGRQLGADLVLPACQQRHFQEVIAVA